MGKIVSVHSFRGGTGKSNLTANLATSLALTGKRVGIVDTDIQSPGIHVLFGLDEEHMSYALNDYLWGTCSIAQAAYDVTARLDAGTAGQLFLIPGDVPTLFVGRVLSGLSAGIFTGTATATLVTPYARWGTRSDTHAEGDHSSGLLTFSAAIGSTEPALAANPVATAATGNGIRPVRERTNPYATPVPRPAADAMSLIVVTS